MLVDKRVTDEAELHLDTDESGDQRLTLHLGPKAVEIAKQFNSALTEKPLPNPILLAEYDASQKTLRTYPTVTKVARSTFSDPKYRFRSILFDGMNPMESEGTSIMFAGRLPAGFEIDAFDGLGAYWGLRFVFSVAEDLEFDEVFISKYAQDLSIKERVFTIPMKRFDEWRRAINRAHGAAVEFANEDKVAYLRGVILEPFDPEVDGTFQRSPEDLHALVSHALLRPGKRSGHDNNSAAVKAVRRASKVLAEKKPAELYALTRTVEAVTLATLIEKFEKKLDEGHSESHWQRFFTQNPFILRMAFGLPIAVFGEQVSVGGTGFKGSGGKLSDYVIKTGLQGNLGIIEIKKPGTVLVESKPYRGKVHPPTKDLAGAVTQVLDQRFRLQQEITQKKENDNIRDIYAYSVSCIVIAGREIEPVDHKKSFELFRGGQRDVLIITFDEVLTKLKALHDFLRADDDIRASGYGEEDLDEGDDSDLEEEDVEQDLDFE